MYFVISVIFVCLILQYSIIRIYKKKVGIPIKKFFNKQPTYFFNSYVKNKYFSKAEAEKNRYAYFATLIHDLKSPTYAQIRTLKLLLSGAFGSLSKEQTEIIKETLNSENYLAEIVTNILTAYRCESNVLKLNIETLDLAKIINEICDRLRPLSEEKSQKITLSLKGSGGVIINADRLQITRVISNLLSNAIRYGFENSVINIKLKTAAENIELAVENESVPIPQDKLSSLFEKFSNGEMGHYNSASTGLGLYLSKQIIEMHGGKIFAKSTTSGMCTFGFMLPKNIKMNSVESSKSVY